MCLYGNIFSGTMVYLFRCVAVSGKTEFLSNRKNVSMKNLTKASEDPVFNLAIDKKESPGNKAASLTNKLVKREMGNRHRELFEVFGGKLAYWLLLLVNTNSDNSPTKPVQKLSGSWAKSRK